MDQKHLGDVRQLAQDALSRARLANDPALKRQWQRLAEAWLEHLASLEKKSVSPRQAA